MSSNIAPNNQQKKALQNFWNKGSCGEKLYGNIL